MASRAVFLVTVIFLLAEVQRSSAIKCYSCLPGEKGCNDPFPEESKEKYEEDCKQYKHCIKVDYKDDVYARFCGPEDSCGIFKTCHTCTSNLCNNAQHFLPSSIILATAVALVLAKYWAL